MENNECTAIVTDWRTKYFQEVDLHNATKDRLTFYETCFEVACHKAAQIYRGDLAEYLYAQIYKAEKERK